MFSSEARKAVGVMYVKFEELVNQIEIHEVLYTLEGYRYLFNKFLFVSCRLIEIKDNLNVIMQDMIKM